MEGSQIFELKLVITGVGLLITGAELLSQPRPLDAFAQVCVFIGAVLIGGAFIWKEERFFG